MNIESKTLEAFYYDSVTEIYYAVFEDGYIHHSIGSFPSGEMSTIEIDGRIVINLHLGEEGLYINYYHDIEEGSNTSVYDGQDYYCEVRMLEHSIPPKEKGEYPKFQVEHFQRVDGAKYFAKWAKGYQLNWS